MKILKIKLTKIKELPDAMYKLNIAEGFETTEVVLSDMFKEPTVGFRFNLGAFSTSPVQEILSNVTFKTFSSIYSWEILSEEEVDMVTVPKKKK